MKLCSVILLSVVAAAFAMRPPGQTGISHTSTIGDPTDLQFGIYATADVPVGEAHEVLVDTPLGTVKGVSSNGVDSFQGIPFAKPPLPPLRFKAPQEPDAWSGVYDATFSRDACTQLFPSIIGRDSEDCLYLNVFRPANMSSTGAPIPVMFWVHGGAYMIGAAWGYPGGPLIRHAHQPVILVTVAYRLGPFGFLTLPGLEEDFNAGLLDMVMGLKWVHENIKAFGGDPDSVTIFGESAGGHAVAALLGFGPAWPYFHRAIIESGGYGSEKAIDSIEKSLDLASRVGCPGTNSTEVMDCMQNVPAQLFDGEGMSPVDRYSVVPEALNKMWKQGSISDVPIMLGTNELEGLLFVDMYAPNEKEITDEQYLMVMSMVIPSEYLEWALQLYEPIRKREGNRIGAAHALGDYMFSEWYPAANGTMFMKSPMFVYLFVQQNARTGEPPTHFEEVPYVFGWLLPTAPAGNQMVMDDMIQWWVSFAASGDPNAHAASRQHWPPYDPAASTPTMMSISEDPFLIHEYNRYYSEAWNDVKYPEDDS